MAGRRLAPDEDRARQLYAYLESTAGEAGVAREAAPFTIVRVVTSLPDLVGDARRGADIYGRACRRCHAPAHAVAGRLTPLAGQVPEDTVKSFPKNARHAVVEKIRHGRFFNIGGLMPLYAREVLSDEEVADVLAHLGL
jgi:thiosulfate dehydrogenase